MVAKNWVNSLISLHTFCMVIDREREVQNMPSPDTPASQGSNPIKILSLMKYRPNHWPHNDTWYKAIGSIFIVLSISAVGQYWAHRVHCCVVCCVREFGAVCSLTTIRRVGSAQNSVSRQVVRTVAR